MEQLAQSVKARAVALMEQVLRSGAPLQAEYPLVFDERFPGRVLALEENGVVVSACAALVRDFLVGANTMRIGLIGSVVTHPEHRGRGLATELLGRAERALAQDGCWMALLWADDPVFYDERGWRPVGCEYDFVLESWHEGRLCGANGIRAAAPDDWGAIHRLYTLHRERVDRSLDETRALLAGPGVEVLVLQRSRDVVAYTCLGRGADLARTVHEWSGADADVMALVRAHMQRSKARGEDGPTYLLTPPGARSLHDRLRGCGLTCVEGVLAQGKLLDPHAAAALLGALAGPQATLSVESQVESSHGPGRVVLGGPAGASVIEARELLDVLVPARGRRARIDALTRETGLTLSALPLPLFAWGLDSI